MGVACKSCHGGSGQDLVMIPCHSCLKPPSLLLVGRDSLLIQLLARSYRERLKEAAALGA